MCNLPESTDDDPVAEEAFTDAVKAVVPRATKSFDFVERGGGQVIAITTIVDQNGNHWWHTHQACLSP